MRFCLGCPVRPECKEFGVESGGEGIWGGKFLSGGKVK